MAELQAEEIISKAMPSAVISIECPGANSKGVYHNAVGLDVTELEAKQDILFEILKKKGVLNIAIGDLGNEIGMGTLKEQLEEFIPYAGKGRCRCDCKGGIAAKVKADNIITATVSDWGCYGLIAALSYLKKDLSIMHTEKMEEQAMITASRSGMIDMYGDLIPAIDGCSLEMNTSIVRLMRETVKSAIENSEKCETWFHKVLELGFYEKNSSEDHEERIVKKII